MKKRQHPLFILFLLTILLSIITVVSSWQPPLHRLVGAALFSHNSMTLNQTTTASTSQTSIPMMKIRAHRTSDILACANHVRTGGLVAFPTETVYGLGCRLTKDAIQKVFIAKQRPLTDPLIVHVLQAKDAYPLWEATSLLSSTNQQEARILRTLCETFWPGPLTLVARANPDPILVPNTLMANTGFVAIRSPQHIIARQLLRIAGIPIAAPSANKFGHVSPTTAHHVWDDLKHEPVWILDEPESSSSPCHVGVESTVAKLERIQIQNDKNGGTDAEKYEFVLTILRQGAVSLQDLSDCCRAMLGPTDIVNNIRVTSRQRTTNEHTANVAPGQLIRHYSPNVPSFLVKEPYRHDDNNNGSLLEKILSKTVVIDFGSRLVHWKSHALEYRDLSPEGNSKEAARQVFDTLRWAEQISNAERIVFPDFPTHIPPQNDDALTIALKDRLTRAASGVVLDKLS